MKRYLQPTVYDISSLFYSCFRDRLNEFQGPFQQLIFLHIMLQLMVAIFKKMENFQGFHVIIDKTSRTLVLHHRILFSMEDDNRQTELTGLLLNPFYRDQQRFGHFYTQKRYHESILEDCMQIIILFSQGSRIYHRIYDQIFQLITNQFNYEYFQRVIPLFLGYREKRASYYASTDANLRSFQDQLDRDQPSHAMGIHEQRQFRIRVGQE